MFTSIRRTIKYGWQSFYRDGEIAIATIFILFLAVMLVSFLFLFQDITQFLISSIQDRIDISVYFREEVQEPEILGLRDEIYKIPEVRDVEYVSKDKALEEFIIRHENEEILLESIEEVGINPFLASLNIRAWDPTQYVKVSDFLEQPEFENIIEKVDYYQRKMVIDRVSAISSTLTRAGIIFSAVLIFVAIAVTYNTIRLSIYNSRKEIGIQKLVGASNWFVRGPFLIQGIICGVLASLISLLAFSGIMWFVSPKIEAFFLNFNMYAFFIENFWTVVEIQFITAIGLGVFSSLIAVGKYLKEI